MATDSDILKDAREAFKLAEDYESDNRRDGEDDIRFARLGEQWPDHIRRQREAEKRPMLTIPRMNSFIRQVVNDARQNKPSIKVHPVDDAADIETAEIFNGLIRHIEYTSNADVAYDTAVECAVSAGFGYFRIGMDYVCDDVFDMDLSIERVGNPFTIYGDPDSKAADSSDWNSSFVVDYMPQKQFKRTYKGAQAQDWEGESAIGQPWFGEDQVLVAEWWTREEYERQVVQLSNGTVLDRDALEKDEQLQAVIGMGGLTVNRERTAKAYRVKQFILTGADVLDRTDWPGRYIPIVPVYGDEINLEGKRYFRSLIHDAKDAQRMFNYWRTTGTELVALAPRVPYIGKVGQFATDAEKWATANTHNWPYMEYDDPNDAGLPPPQRQPLDMGVAAGALQESLNASDDMKAIIGLYDASLGARSNETSGKAIMARQREGDVSTFHFLDNMARAIRHAGRILVDLIPHVYGDQERIVRIIGEDERERTAALNKPVPVTDDNGKPVMDEQTGLPMTRVFDLTKGKYDLTVKSGPSFTSRREESATMMTELIRAFPAAAPVLGGLIARNFDWPNADEVAKRLDAIAPPGAADGLPAPVQKMIEEGRQKLAEQGQRLQQLELENASLKADRTIDAQKLEIDRTKVEVDKFKAVTDRMQAQQSMAAPLVTERQ